MKEQEIIFPEDEEMIRIKVKTCNSKITISDIIIVKIVDGITTEYKTIN